MKLPHCSKSNSASLDKVQEVAEMCRKLTELGHPYFPADNKIKINLPTLRKSPTYRPEIFLTSSYDDFCFDERVTSLAGRTTFSSINELSSGNNDLGHFASMYQAAMDATFFHQFHLRNYSGGRGDYFTLKELLVVENALHELITGALGNYNIGNIALTLGGQGGYSGIAGFLKTLGKKVIFPDSTYCQCIKPFSRAGVELCLLPSPEESCLPDMNLILEQVESGTISAVFHCRYFNPSGEEYSYQDLEKLVLACKRNDCYLINSEVYEDIYLGDEASPVSLNPILQISANHQFTKLLRVKTLSKERGLAGLRAAYVIGSKEVVGYVLRFSDEVCYNAPVSNNILLVLNAYLYYLQCGGTKINRIEEWLQPVNIDQQLIQFSIDREKQRQTLRNNFGRLCEILLGDSFDSALPGSYLRGDLFEIIKPVGGINCILRIRNIEGYDQHDMVRKVFLGTGLILHTSAFTFEKKGMWLRITLSHQLDRIERGLNILKRIIETAHTWDFLRENSLSFEFTAGHRN
jgi:histidinol-phosphate/aromatic aminotransferase/cobyric acid decarboxylase-like protein